MKSRTAILALCGFICSTSRLQAGTPINADGDYETVTRTDIPGDSDRIENFALNPALRISGNISGSMPTSIAAIRDDGAVFLGVIDSSTANYAVIVPAGTYAIRVCSTLSATTVTYDDPVPVVVASDTRRDEMVPGSTTWVVSGTVNGIDAGNFASILFASADGRAGASGLVFPFLKTYSVNVPDGNYSVAITQFNPATSGVSLFPVGTAVVSGGPLAMDFTIGSRANLSGTVTRATGSGESLPAGIPPNSIMQAIDSTARPLAGFNCVSPAFAAGIGLVDQGSGAYAMRLLTGLGYFLSGIFQIQPADPPQSAGVWVQTDPLVLDFSGEMTRDMTLSVPPGTIVISGTVTGRSSLGGGVPVQDGEVDAVAQGTRASSAPEDGPVAPPNTFARATRTDSAGNYRLVVPQGLTYRLTVSGRPPVP